MEAGYKLQAAGSRNFCFKGKNKYRPERFRKNPDGKTYPGAIKEVLSVYQRTKVFPGVGNCGK